MNEIYKIVHFGPPDIWLIFDTVEGNYLEEEFSTKTAVEARVDELMRPFGEVAAESGTSGDEPDDLDLEAEMESANNSSSKDLRGDSRDGKRGNQVVLDALVGKVVCSYCNQEYHGPAAGIAVAPGAAPVHGIKVTRYIGFDTPNLKVDLTCNYCAHTGLYHFNGNPLIDAGIIEKIPL